MFRATGNARAIPSGPARHDHAELRLERELLLEEQRRSRRPGESRVARRRRAGERVPCLGHRRLAGDPGLAAAVVAAERGLEAGGKPHVPKRDAQLGRAADLAPARDPRPLRLDPPSLGEPVLGDAKREQARPDGDAGGQHGLGERRLHVLQLVRDDGAAARQLRRRGRVVVAALTRRSATDAAGQAGSGSRTAMR